MFSNTSSVFPNREDMTDRAENGIEIDGLPSEEVIPFGGGETERSFGRGEYPLFDLGDVSPVTPQQVRCLGTA